MRTVAAALQTAQRSNPRTPYVEVTAHDRFGGIARLRPATWYSGSEAAGPHAAYTQANALIRLRIEAATLYHQRVTTPSAGSTYSSWTSYRAASRLVAAAPFGTGAFIVAVDDANPAQVYVATQSGAIFGGFALAFTHTSTITCIAAAAKSATDYVIIVNTGANVSAYRWNGASWTGPTTTTDGAVTPTGLALYYHGDFNAVVTGDVTLGAGSRLLSRIFGDGFSVAANTWGTARPIADLSAASSVDYSAPFAERPDTARLTVRETYTGTGAYDRIHTSYSPAGADFNENLWREPVPFNLDHDYGLAIAYNSTHLFHCTPARVYAQSLTVSSLDLTADVLALDYPDAHLSTAPIVVTLRNSAGTYPPGTITKGMEVRVSPGYRTSSGPLTSGYLAAWVQEVVHDYDENPYTVRLICRPLAWWLSTWRTPRPIRYTSKNPFSILSDLFARAGFELSSSGASSEATALTPPVIIPANTSGLTAVRRVLSRLPDRIVTRAEIGIMNEPLAADTADEDYYWKTGSGHPIIGARYRDALKDFAHYRLIGAPALNVVADAIDYDEAQLAYASPDVTVDRDLVTALVAQDRVDALARHAAIDSRADFLRAAVHCGLEVNDVITVTDSRPSLSSEKKRVIGLRLRYERGQRGRYDHEVTLGEV